MSTSNIEKVEKPRKGKHALLKTIYIVVSDRMEQVSWKSCCVVAAGFTVYTEVSHQTLNPTVELWCKSLSRIKVDLVLRRT